MLLLKSHRRQLALALVAAGLAMSAVAAQAQDLRMATAAFPPSLGNPFTGVNQPSSELWLSIYDGLTYLDWGKDAKPGLALSWKNTTPTTWIFRIRPNVTFHNGKRFTSADVVKIFKMLKSPEGAGYLIAGEVQNIVSMRSPDELTLEIETRVPDAILPKRLSVVMIVDPDQWEKTGRDGYARTPIGTGPYRLVTWGAGDKDAALEAFERSWRAPVSVQRLQYRVIVEHNARLQALVSNQVDMASGLQIDDVADLEAQGLTIYVQPNPQVKSIALRNLQDGTHPLKDQRVRQALNHAVDKDAIAKLMMLGYVTPVGQGAPPGLTGHNPDVKPYTFDPARARALLTEAGYPNGLSMNFAVVTANATPDALIYQKMAQDLAVIGVKVNLQSITFADYQGRYATGNWGTIDAFSQIWNNAAYQDPIRAIEYFSCLKPNPFFCEVSLVPAIKQINAEIDVVKRESQLRALMAEIHNVAPAIWITNAAYVTGTTSKVTAFEMLPTGIAFERLKVRAP